MIDPRHLSIKDYSYFLPEEKIAKYPLDKRDNSKLLIYKQKNIAEDIYSNISDHIPPHSLLVFNDTKVIEARILFKKDTGGIIEIFCLAPHEKYADIRTAMLQKEKVLWECLIGGASKWKHGQVLEKKIRLKENEILLHATYVEKRSDCFIIEFLWHPENITTAEILHLAGAIPLPPYIKREVEESDAERYQTVYAHYPGSVAAPTAGLHFTEDVFKKLEEKNVQKSFITLHVGGGTFKPVKTGILEQHEMHAEFIDVSKQTIECILKNLDNNIITVGTTSLRTIESLYWLGVKIKLDPFLQPGLFFLSQWEVYRLAQYDIPVKEALELLLASMKEKKNERLISKTQILIAPGYKVKIARALITNFHQPQSTLLLLVAALIGDDWKRVYDYALNNDFRFLSYGDGSLLWLDQQ